MPGDLGHQPLNAVYHVEGVLSTGDEIVEETTQLCQALLYAGT